MEPNRHQRELLKERPKKPPPIGDMRCGLHQRPGCLDCWNQIIWMPSWLDEKEVRN